MRMDQLLRVQTGVLFPTDSHMSLPCWAADEVAVVGPTTSEKGEGQEKRRERETKGRDHEMVSAWCATPGSWEEGKWVMTDETCFAKIVFFFLDFCFGYGGSR